MAEDFRTTLDCYCSACGAYGKDVIWARLGSSYENGHILGGPMSEPCGPMVLTEDYELLQRPPAYRPKVHDEAEKRFLAVLDAARP